VLRPPPDAVRLRALAAKYRTLGVLRRERAAGAGPASRETLREIASAFPGALRELDTLSLDEIDRRARDLDLAARAGGEPSAPWMHWIDAYHRWMRAGLYVKLRLAQGLVLSNADGERQLATAASAHAGVTAGADFVHGIAAQRSARLQPPVLARVSAETGTSVREITATLFPRLPRRGTTEP